MYKKYVKDQKINYFFLTNLKAESVNDHLTQKCKRSPDTRQIIFSNKIMTFIEKLQKDCCGYSSAKAARMQAKSLQQLATGIYSGPERFVYELLQNAVDAYTDTNEDSLRIKIYSEGNYFVFLHNGAAFSERDVDGLCDVGNGNKGGDNKKVGYKGIGFKSNLLVFVYLLLLNGGLVKMKSLGRLSQ